MSNMKFSYNPQLIIRSEELSGCLRYKIKADGCWYVLDAWSWAVAREIVSGEEISAISRKIDEDYGIKKSEDELLRVIDYLLAFKIISADSNIDYEIESCVSLAQNALSLKHKKQICGGNKLEKIGDIFSFFFLKRNRFFFSFAYLICIVLFFSIIIFRRDFYVYNSTSIIEMPIYMSILVILNLVSIAVHELGHIAAARFCSIKIDGLGVGLYWFTPVCYVHLPDQEILNSRERLMVDSGGLYFEAIYVSFLIICFFFMNNLGLLGAIIIINISILNNLNPFMKTDGYWILTDWLNIPNLHQRVEDIIKGKQIEGLNRKKRFIIVIYILFFLLSAIVTLVFVIASLPKMLSTFSNIIGIVISNITSAVSDRQYIVVFAYLVYLIALFAPCLYIFLLMGSSFNTKRNTR